MTTTRQQVAEEIALEYLKNFRHHGLLIEKITTNPTLIAMEKERDEAVEDVKELNDILRRAGWGQGEIDSCYSICDDAEQELTALKAKVAELEKDKEMLNWLTRRHFGKGINTETCQLPCFVSDDKSPYVRTAIQNAMQKESGE